MTEIDDGNVWNSILQYDDHGMNDHVCILRSLDPIPKRRIRNEEKKTQTTSAFFSHRIFLFSNSKQNDENYFSLPYSYCVELNMQ